MNDRRMDDQFDFPLLPSDFDVQISEEAFLEELDKSINPFLRGDLQFSQYLRGESLEGMYQNGYQLPGKPIDEKQQPCGNPTSVRNEQQYILNNVRSGGSEQNLLCDGPRNEVTDSEQSRDQRFADTLSNLCEWMTPFVSKSTRKNTKWALTYFNAWRQHYNRVSKNVCPQLEAIEEERELCHWLTCFVLGTRSANGKEYLPRTITMLLSGLHRHIVDKNPSGEHLNFMNKRNPAYRGLWSACDRLFRELRAKGIRAKPKTAAIITFVEEDTLWKKGILGMDTPRSLLNAVFYLNGKNFHLRGGDEHKFLRISQLQYHRDPERYEYVEGGSKNHPGGLDEVMSHAGNKIVPIMANSGDRCHVCILNKYLSKIPPAAFQHDYFYLRPVKQVGSDGFWYTTQVVGRNTLAKMVPNMFVEAGIEKNATNHSLRSTGTSQLFCAGVPEKIIMQRTGHKSLDGVCAYERTSGEQQMAVSKILTEQNGRQSGQFNDVVGSIEKEKKYIPVKNENTVPETEQVMNVNPRMFVPSDANSSSKGVMSLLCRVQSNHSWTVLTNLWQRT